MQKAEQPAATRFIELGQSMLPSEPGVAMRGASGIGGMRLALSSKHFCKAIGHMTWGGRGRHLSNEGVTMNHSSDLPLALYKANSELQLRISKLVMENWKKWLELSTRAMDDGIAESQSRVEQLLKAQDWSALATMPVETFGRMLQQRLGDANVTNHIAASVQAHFAQGLQEAIQTWQKDTARALGGMSDLGSVANAPWNDAMAQWSSMWPWAAQNGAPGSSK